jgi:signal transduction histidine kinase
LQIADQPVHVGEDSPLKKSISVTKTLILSHSQNILSFEFAALSYADTERTRYRYRLEGLEKGWNEVASTQHFVRYSTLAPSKYVFHVEARTNRGNWTEKGAEIRVVILPPWWASSASLASLASWPFRAGCAVIIVISLGFAHYYRLQHIARQLNVRFEERLAERTRIAQELHDTLLQGFISASMQLHVAANSLPEDSPAKPRIGHILGLIGPVIEEGRNALRGLRSRHRDALDLEQALSRIAEELPNCAGVEFRVIVDGFAQPFHPVVRDEVYRIGREAVINAFRHSGAKNIEVELDYTTRNRLRVLVCDDGRGIDPQVLRSGREGHWGLTGMPERAERIGGQLRVWSRPALGTEVEISVPNHASPQFISASRLGRWLGWPKRDLS